ncbi:MAG: epoxyqueuosine reductase QueH [Lachnospiraceae bacterium]|nr:epoxyqueuosine reductase QueH [Lachnospiraceae bacterium]
MNVINYQKELDKIIEKIQKEGRRPSLLLHSCCAPCSSYCMEYLTQYFDITVYYYNPNITDEEEYRLRVEEQQRLIREFPGIKFEEGPYDPESFFAIAKGLEMVPEGGERCFRCYELRLKQAVEAAKLGGYDYVTTTLTISPLKNSKKLNEIGEQLAGENWLPSDFKKKNGYKRSVELSVQYDLYRQNYCGCVYSKKEAERREAAQ